MNTKDPAVSQAVVGRPTEGHDISGRPLSRDELTALLLIGEVAR